MRTILPEIDSPTECLSFLCFSILEEFTENYVLNILVALLEVTLL